jgi:hypothetical protein
MGKPKKALSGLRMPLNLKIEHGVFFWRIGSG